MTLLFLGIILGFCAQGLYQLGLKIYATFNSNDLDPASKLYPKPKVQPETIVEVKKPLPKRVVRKKKS